MYPVAGWKESEAVFTDALAKLLTSGPASSASSKAEQSSRQQPASRRMLAAPLHTNRQADLAADMLQQADSNQLERHSMHSMPHQSKSNLQTQHSMNSTVAVPAELPLAAVSNLNNQTPAAFPAGSCLAVDSTAVCRDVHQPAFQVADWDEQRPEASAKPKLQLQQCQLLNSSICSPSVQLSKEGKRFMVVVYNSLAWDRPTEPVRVPVSMPADTTTHWLVTGMRSCLGVLSFCQVQYTGLRTGCM